MVGFDELNACRWSEHLRVQLMDTVLSKAPLPRVLAEKSEVHTVSMLRANVVISPNEVNERHGTGVLIKRHFDRHPNLVSIRSHDDYGGEHTFADASLLLAHPGANRKKAYLSVSRALELTEVRRVLCVPFYPDDVLSAIAIKDIFDVPLCTYVMDDNSIYKNGISQSLVNELLKKSTLCLAISPELRDAYERQYGVKFWMLPPTVRGDLLLSGLQKSLPTCTAGGVLVGNVWGQHWLRLLRATVSASGEKIDWYGNPPREFQEQLTREGLVPCGYLTEPQLSVRLRDYQYALIPSGTLDEDDDQRALAELSLPSRVLLIMAASGTPLVVLGHPNTAAAKFVRRFGIGVVCGYDAAEFKDAVATVTSAAMQTQMRAKAAHVADHFRGDGIGEWIWNSLALGEPVDDRFERLFARSNDSLVPYVEPPVPRDIYPAFKEIYEALRRLKKHGFLPDFVIDVGASSGVWSHYVHGLFPTARFVLVEPLTATYGPQSNNYYATAHPEFEWVCAAASDCPGETSFQVSEDLYGSSLLAPADFRSYHSVPVQLCTLDGIAAEKQLLGRGLLKIDVQGAEHLVLEGARKLLEQVDAVALELSLLRYDARAKVMTEMIDLLDALGFRYYDDIGCWRSPVDGTLLQKDVLFLRHSFLLSPLSESQA